MAETACGKNRLPFTSDTSEEKRQCELDAWESFASQCGGCATPECVNQLFQQYLDVRAKCASSPEAP